jgi:hypothetical protein
MLKKMQLHKSVWIPISINSEFPNFGKLMKKSEV